VARAHEAGFPTGVKSALVGCGRIGARHAALLASFAGMQFSGCVDTDVRRAEDFARRHGARGYAGIAQMIAAEGPDLVAICTPSGIHAENVMLAARSGVPNIVVEKPMALRLEDADRMIEACDTAGARLFVVQQNRFNLPILKLREAVDQGRFGKLVLGTVRVRWCRRQDYYDQASWRGTWAMDGGVFSNQASHHIDMLVSVMGPVESVIARSARRLVSIEAEDTGVALLRFASGAVGIVEATTAARPSDLEGSISVLGENGTVEVGGFAMNEMKIWRFADERPGDQGVLERYRTNPPDVYGFGHHEFYRDVFASIATGHGPTVDGLEGRKSLEVIVAIYEAIDSGEEVRLPFTPRHVRLGRTGISPEPGSV
jgi:predicted dehydrogenase